MLGDADQHRAVWIDPGSMVFRGFAAHDRLLGINADSPCALIGSQNQHHTPASFTKCGRLAHGVRPVDVIVSVRRRRSRCLERRCAAGQPARPPGDTNRGRRPGADSRPSGPMCLSHEPRPPLPGQPPSGRRHRGKSKTTALALPWFASCSKLDRGDGPSPCQVLRTQTACLALCRPKRAVFVPLSLDCGIQDPCGSFRSACSRRLAPLQHSTTSLQRDSSRFRSELA